MHAKSSYAKPCGRQGGYMVRYVPSILDQNHDRNNFFLIKVKNAASDVICSSVKYRYPGLKRN